MVRQTIKRGVLLWIFLYITLPCYAESSYWTQGIHYFKNSGRPLIGYLQKKKEDMRIYIIRDLGPQLIEAVFLDQTRKNIKKSAFFVAICVLVISGYYFQNRAEKQKMHPLYPFIKRKNKFSPVRQF